MDESLADQVGALFAERPDDFVAARKRLVSRLKQAGRRDDAAVVAALRRPSWIDGALNRVVSSDSDVVAEFVDAARSARRIQHADALGRRTGSLPEALQGVRAAQGRLAAAGDAALVDLGRKPDLAGLTARLGQIGADPTALGLLAAGVLGLDHGELTTAFVADPETDDETLIADADAEASDDGTANSLTWQRQLEAATRTARSADQEAQVAATAARRAAERRDRAAAAVGAAAEALRHAELALERERAELADHERRASDAERLAEDTAATAAEAAARLEDLTDRAGADRTGAD